MNYDNPELMQYLAAEYALGTLRGPARRRFEQLLATHSALGEQVAFWETRLSDFGAKVTPVPPPVAAKSALMAAAMPEQSGGDRTRQRQVDRVGSHGVWRRRLLPGAAAAASLVAAFLLGKQTVGERPPIETDPSTPFLSVLGDPTRSVFETAHERYVAQIRLPASRVEWLVSVSSDQKRLSIVAAEDCLTHGLHRLQLWWISETQDAVALATLPAIRGETVTLDIPAALQGRVDGTFAVSMEPGGTPSPFDRPRGPVLSRTAQLDMI
jgi:anti-sigma-K factor RskA